MLLAAAFLAGAVTALVSGLRGPQHLEAEPQLSRVARTPSASTGDGRPGERRADAVDEALLASSAAPGCVRARGDEGLLNDFERSEVLDGHRITTRSLDGRAGEWFHMRNTGGTASQAEPLRLLESPEAEPGHPDNQTALLIAGPAPKGWGVNAGIRFERCYDASAYAGVEFRARGQGGLFVGFQTLDSVPEEMGGRCTHKCWFTGGRYIVLTERFATHRIRWKDVRAPDPSYDVSKELMQLMFSVQSGSEPYEFWLDDLRLIPEGE